MIHSYVYMITFNDVVAWEGARSLSVRSSSLTRPFIYPLRIFFCNFLEPAPPAPPPSPPTPPHPPRHRKRSPVAVVLYLK